MFSTRIYLKIVFQVALILLVTGVGLTGIITGKAIILGCVTLLIALWLVGILVYFLNTSNRRIQLFLDAIEDNESMLYFPENSGPEEQRRLHTAFNRIHRLMTESKQKEFERELLTRSLRSSPSQARSSPITGATTRRKAATRSTTPPSGRRSADWIRSRARDRAL